MSERPVSHFQRHVFFCINQRDDGRACCADRGSVPMWQHAKARVKALGLSGPGKVRINQAGCLDRCDAGPVCVVYPDAVWYTFIDQHDVDEIIDSHLKQGKIVERLRIDG
jgi:(2Fe-2S) ferredoxin